MTRLSLRSLLAALFAPFVGSLVGTPIYFAIAALIADGQDVGAALGSGFVIGLYSGVAFGLPAMFVIGLPAHVALTAFDLRRGWNYSIAGAVPGMAIGAVVLLLFGDAPSDPAYWAPALMLGAFTGSLTAWIFWLIRRPDRDAANPPTSPP